MRYKSYYHYLRSPTWKAKKQAVFERALKNSGSKNEFGICEQCGYEPKRKGLLQCHHTRYPLEWGKESIDSLILLCGKCHKERHHIE